MNGPAEGFELGLDTQVAGNSSAESTQNLWPLYGDHTWRYHGHAEAYGNEHDGRLQIRSFQRSTYEGQPVWQVDFIKDEAGIYWGPQRNENLSWYVVDFDQSSADFMWARGDRRFDRGALPEVVMSTRYAYASLESDRPAYALLPRTLQPNPSNDGLVNSTSVRSQYSLCRGRLQLRAARRRQPQFVVHGRPQRPRARPLLRRHLGRCQVGGIRGGLVLRRRGRARARAATRHRGARPRRLRL